MNENIIEFESTKKRKRDIIDTFRSLEIHRLLDKQRKFSFRESFYNFIVSRLRLYISGEMISEYNDIAYYHYTSLYTKYTYKYKDLYTFNEEESIYDIYIPILFFHKLDIPLVSLMYSDINLQLDLNNIDDIMLADSEIKNEISIDSLQVMTYNVYLHEIDRTRISLSSTMIYIPTFEIFDTMESLKNFSIINLDFQYPSKCISWGIWNNEQKKNIDLNIYKASELALNNTKISKNVAYHYYVQKYQNHFQLNDTMIYYFDQALSFYKFKSKYLFLEFINDNTNQTQNQNINIIVVSFSLRKVGIYQGYIF